MHLFRFINYSIKINLFNSDSHEQWVVLKGNFCHLVRHSVIGRARLFPHPSRPPRDLRLPCPPLVTANRFRLKLVAPALNWFTISKSPSRSMLLME